MHSKLRIVYDVVSPVGRIHGSRTQGVEAGVSCLPFTPKDPVEEFCISHPHNSKLCVSRGFSSKKEIFPPEDTPRVTLNPKWWLLPGHFGVTILLGLWNWGWANATQGGQEEIHLTSKWSTWMSLWAVTRVCKTQGAQEALMTQG